MSEIGNEPGGVLPPYTVDFRKLPNQWVSPAQSWDIKDADGAYKGSIAVGQYEHGAIAFQQMIYSDGVAVTVRYPAHANMPGLFRYAVETTLPGFGEHRGEYKTILGDRDRLQRTIETESCYDASERLLDKSGSIHINPRDYVMMGYALDFGVGSSVAYNVNFGDLSLYVTDFYRQSFEHCCSGLHLNICESFDDDGRIMTVNRDRRFTSPEGILGDFHFPSVDFRNNGAVIIYEGGSSDKFQLCEGTGMERVILKDACAPF